LEQLEDRTVISTWTRLAIFQTLSMGEGDWHTWFAVDALDALEPIDGLSDALPRLRKFGGRCALGFQSISQVSTTYGQGLAQAMMVENCGNTLVLRSISRRTNRLLSPFTARRWWVLISSTGQAACCEMPSGAHLLRFPLTRQSRRVMNLGNRLSMSTLGD
jgi:hypothetical protein